MATRLDSMIAARLSRLPRDARQRVEDALRRTLELELAREAGDAHALGFSRSRSLVFGRSSGDARDDGEPDYRLLLGLAALDEEAFAAFLRRFTALRHSMHPDGSHQPGRDGHEASHAHVVDEKPAGHQSRRAGTTRATATRPAKHSTSARTTRRKR